MELIFLFAVDEEEGLVLPDRAADGAAELVQVELLDGVGEVALGIEMCCGRTRRASRESYWFRILM